jgi:hypothetical protein
MMFLLRIRAGKTMVFPVGVFCEGDWSVLDPVDNTVKIRELHGK